MGDDAVAVNRAGSLNVHAASFVPQVISWVGRVSGIVQFCLELFAPSFRLIQAYLSSLGVCPMQRVHPSWRALCRPVPKALHRFGATRKDRLKCFRLSSGASRSCRPLGAHFTKVWTKVICRAYHIESTLSVSACM